MPRSLHETVYLCRTFGYLLAALLLTQLHGSTFYLHCWVLALVVYPHVLEWFVVQAGGDHKAVKTAMLLDAVMVGLLVSLTGFNLEAGVVLTTLLCISLLIVGGLYLLIMTCPLVVSGLIAGSMYHPVELAGDSGFYFTSFAVLVAYMVFVGILVYRETRRLKFETRRERGMRETMEKWGARWQPFVAGALLERRPGTGRCRKHLTVLFCDIEGITSLVAQGDGQVAGNLLDRYFTAMAGIVLAYGGTVDKFLGDGLMVFFGDPTTRGPREDALRCLRMAVAMQEKFRVLADRWEQDTGYPRLYHRTGIHAGMCLVGEYGSGERRDYTAVGAAVNVAGALERAAERDEILVSGEMLSVLGDTVTAGPRGCVFPAGTGRPAAAVSAWAVTGAGNTAGVPAG